MERGGSGEKEGIVEQLVKWLARHPTVALMAGGGTLAALCLGLIYALGRMNKGQKRLAMGSVRSDASAPPAVHAAAPSASPSAHGVSDPSSERVDLDQLRREAASPVDSEAKLQAQRRLAFMLRTAAQNTQDASAIQLLAMALQYADQAARLAQSLDPLRCPQDLMLAGELAQQLHNPKASLGYLGTAVQALLGLGEEYLQHGGEEMLVEQLQMSLVLLTEAAVAAEGVEAVEALIEEVVAYARNAGQDALKPLAEETELMQVSLLLRAGRPERALAKLTALKPARAEAPAEVQDRLALLEVGVLTALERWEEAEGLARRVLLGQSRESASSVYAALLANPDLGGLSNSIHFEALRALLSLQAARGAVDDALSMAHQALDPFSSDPLLQRELLLSLIAALKEWVDDQEKKKLASPSIRLDGGQSIALGLIAWVRTLVQEDRELVAHTHFMEVEMLEKMQRYDEAASSCRALLAAMHQGGDSAEEEAQLRTLCWLHIRLGGLEDAAGHKDRALESYEQGVALVGRAVEALENDGGEDEDEDDPRLRSVLVVLFQLLGRTYGEEGRLAEAEVALTRASALERSRATTVVTPMSLALVLACSGQREAAEKWLKVALSMVEGQGRLSSSTHSSLQTDLSGRRAHLFVHWEQSAESMRLALECVDRYSSEPRTADNAARLDHSLATYLSIVAWDAIDLRQESNAADVLAKAADSAARAGRKTSALLVDLLRAKLAAAFGLHPSPALAHSLLARLSLAYAGTGLTNVQTVLHTAAEILALAGEAQEAVALWEERGREALALPNRLVGVRARIGWAKVLLMDDVARVSDAEALLAEAVAEARALALHTSEGVALALWAQALRRLGRLDEAATVLRDAMAVAESRHHVEVVAWTLRERACAAKDDREAADLREQARSVAELSGQRYVALKVALEAAARRPRVEALEAVADVQMRAEALGLGAIRHDALRVLDALPSLDSPDDLSPDPVLENVAEAESSVLDILEKVSEVSEEMVDLEV